MSSIGSESVCLSGRGRYLKEHLSKKTTQYPIPPGCAPGSGRCQRAVTATRLFPDYAPDKQGRATLANPRHLAGEILTKKVMLHVPYWRVKHPTRWKQRSQGKD